MKGIVLSFLLISLASAHRFCKNTDFVVFDVDKTLCDMPRSVFASLLLIDDNSILDLKFEGKSAETVDRNTQFDLEEKAENCDEKQIKDCEVHWDLASDNAKTGKFKITIKQGPKVRVSVV